MTEMYGGEDMEEGSSPVRPVPNEEDGANNWDERPSPRGPNSVIRAVRAVPPIVSRVLPQQAPQGDTQDAVQEGNGQPDEGEEDEQPEKDDSLEEFVSLSPKDEEFLLGTGDQEEKMLGDSPLDDADSPFSLPSRDPKKTKYSVNPKPVK